MRLWRRNKDRRGCPSTEAVDALAAAEVANERLEEKTGPIEALVDRLAETRRENHIGPAVAAVFARRRGA